MSAEGVPVVCAKCGEAWSCLGFLNGWPGHKRASDVKRPWHTTTLRKCGEFAGAALMLVTLPMLWVLFAATVLAGVLAAAFWTWMLVDAVIGVVT